MFIATAMLFAFALILEMFSKKIFEKLFRMNKGQHEQQSEELTVMAQTFRKNRNKSQGK